MRRDLTATDAVHTVVFNAIITQVVAELVRLNLHILDGRQVLQNPSRRSTDHVCPSDEGQGAMGEALAMIS